MKAKRLVSCVSALAISSAAVLTGFVVSAADTSDVVLKGEHVTAKAGSEFTLNIDLSQLNGDAAKGFSGCEFAIKYDPAKISNVKITEGDALKTGATSAELEKSPTIGDDVTMINGDSYNCFDYNVLKDSGTVAVLWCTGLESSQYWASKTGTILTLSGVVYEGAGEGEKIPVEVVAIDRDGNKDMVFGYTEGENDVFYTASVEQQGLITIAGEDEPPSQGSNYDDLMKNVLWGDVNDNGAVSATDLVAMVKFMVDPETAGVTEQGLVNGNLYQGDKNLDLKSDEIMNAYDLFLLKKYILEDVAEEDFPIMDMKTVK